jgi:hypothetical protein
MLSFCSNFLVRSAPKKGDLIMTTRSIDGMGPFVPPPAIGPNLTPQQRDEIEIPAVDLPAMHQSPSTLSDTELNKWIRFLAKNYPFAIFLDVHSDSIFGLTLQETTRSILRARYLDYVQNGESQIAFKTLIAQKPFQALLSETERKDLKKVVADREAERGRVSDTPSSYRVDFMQDAATYRAFIAEQGVSILPHITNKNLVVGGFIADVLESGVGILTLKEKRGYELQAFGHYERSLFQKIVDRDASLSYEKFCSKNGDDAIAFIWDSSVKKSLLERS